MLENVPYSIVYPLSAFALCILLVPCVRFVAMKKGWVAKPKSDRWHKKTTALMGGIAIYLSISVSLAFLLLSDSFSLSSMPSWAHIAPSQRLLLTLLGGITFLFVLGLIDDLYEIKPQTKLVGQIVIASVVTFLGFRLYWFTSLTLDTMVTLVWIVGLTNAFNLLDNMDGLCAGVGAVCAVSLAALFWGTDGHIVTASLVIAGALAGFLVFNFKPASIFMGDSGSLVIGFAIALLSLFFSTAESKNLLTNIVVPILIFMVPILDTSLVTVIRLLSGRKASTGGRDHTSHRLVIMGFTEKQSVLFLYGVGMLSGSAAVFVNRSDSITSPAVIIPLFLAVLLMGIYLAQLRVYPEKEFSVLRDRSFTPVLIELTYKHQLVMVILDFCLIAFSWYLAYRLRFSAPTFNYYFDAFLQVLPLIIACKIAVFFVMGIYRGFWGNLSTSDVFLCVKASLVATVLSVAAVTFLYRFKDYSKGVFIVDFFITSSFIIGVRGSFKLFMETLKRKTLNGKKVVIYGAGRGGELLLREILNNASLHMKPIGFIDDDGLKRGKKLQGYPIMGSVDDLEAIHQKQGLHGILVSFNGDSNKKVRVKQICRNHGLFLKQFSIDLKDIDIKRYESS